MPFNVGIPPQIVNEDRSCQETAQNVYSKPAGTTAVSGASISSSAYNSTIDDLATDNNTPRPVVAGGTGESSIASMKASFGLRVGTELQSYSDILENLSGLTLAGATGVYATGVSTWGTYSLTPYARGLASAADEAAYHTALGLGAAATRDMSFDADFNNDTDALSPRYLIRNHVSEVPGVLAVL